VQIGRKEIKNIKVTNSMHEIALKCAEITGLNKISLIILEMVQFCNIYKKPG
jgi:hypothetical protein